MKKRLISTITLVMILTLTLALGVSADTGATPTISTSAPVSGELTGNAGGSSWLANIVYPGNDTELTLQLSFAPADPVTLLGVGFNVYSADGSLVGKGALTDAGLIEMAYSAGDAAQLTLQVYNYIDNDHIWFTVTADGLPAAAAPAEVAPAEPAATEGTAVPAEPAAAEPTEEAAPMMEMQGVLTGSAAGSFTHFIVSYSSDDQVTLDMYYTPADNLIAQGVDVNIYGPDGAVTLDAAKVNSNGTLELVFTPEAGVKYQVVVGNYNPDLLISYNIASDVAPASVAIGD